LFRYILSALVAFPSERMLRKALIRAVKPLHTAGTLGVICPKFL
jgi:hypothetical protein